MMQSRGRAEVFGPADYAQAAFQQHITKGPAQSLSVGEDKNVHAGYVKPVHVKAGTKFEVMGAASISMAQASQAWSDKFSSTTEENNESAVENMVSKSPSFEETIQEKERGEEKDIIEKDEL